MSTYSQTTDLNKSPDEVIGACRQAVSQMGWRVLSESPNSIRIKEVAVQVTSFTWPAEIEIVVRSNGSGSSLSLNGSIFGFGPIQSGHLKGQVGNLLNRVGLVLAEQKDSPPQDMASQLQRLADLHKVGSVTDEEFASAKQRILGNP